MPTATQEKVNVDFDKKSVIEFVKENLKKRNPASTLKNSEIEEMIGDKITELVDADPGKTPPEIGAKLSNLFGNIPSHFTFDRYKPFAKDEIIHHRLEAYNEIELAKALNKIRLSERKDKKREWEQARKKERDLFMRYFWNWLQETRGPHKENKLGVKVMVGDDIEIKKGHYHKLY